MKQFSASRLLLTLLAPLVLVLTAIGLPLIGCGGGGGGSSNTPLPTNGNLQVGFVLDPAAVPNSAYKNILLNVQAVRANPSQSPVPDTDPGWVSVPVPVGSTTGELQIDLNTLQQQAQLFNTGAVPPQTYYQIEVVLDPIQGNIVPNCAGPRALFEGCISYGLTFPATSPSPSSATTLLYSYAPNSGGLPVAAGGNTTLILTFNPGTITGPGTFGGTFSASDASIAPAGSATPVPNTPTSFTAVLTGSVDNFVNTSATPPQTVTAEYSGTNTIVASALVQAGSGSAGTYSFSVPATVGGTSYDLYVSGGGGTIGAIQGVIAIANTPVNVPAFEDIEAAPTGSIAGQLVDQCSPGSATPIQGGTVEVLIPPQGAATPEPGTFCKTDPSACVVVATGNSDEAGNYPLPGTFFNPAPLSVVPFLGNGQDYEAYALRITGPGSDNLYTTANVASGVTGGDGICPNPPNTNSSSATNSDCNFSLGAGFITGIASVDVAPTALLQGMVMAEQSGTLNILGLAPITIKPGSTTTTFTIRVPDSTSSPAVTAYDLFDSTLDLYNGALSPNTGHTFGVYSDVAAPPAFCATAVATPTIQTMECAGHSSVNGTIASPNTFTSVQLSQTASNGQQVQLMTSQVGLVGTQSGNSFNFCAPPNKYQLQVYQAAAPTMGAPQPTPVPIGSPTTVILPAPTPTGTPCPICGNVSGQCPGQCSGLTVSLTP